jgi:hypothetical protein
LMAMLYHTVTFVVYRGGYSYEVVNY